MKRILSTIILLSIALMSGCTKTDNVSEAAETTSVQTELSASAMKVSSEATTVTVSETEAPAEASSEDYVYSPPKEVLDTYFYCDYIEAEIVCETIEANEINPFESEENEQAVYSLFKEELPSEIADNVIRNIPWSEYMDDGDVYKVVGIDYMKYDLNSDGKEDYYISASVSNENEYTYLSATGFPRFERAFVTEKDRYTAIEISALSGIHNSCKYILSTSTNGIKDLFAFHNSNSPAYKYDGNTYSGAAEYDEKHTFITIDFVSEKILHLNMNISVIDATLGEYYTAIKFADNPYLKNNLLYTSYPDGTPRSYIRKPFGEYEPNDFRPSQEGYDFYVELNEDMTAEFDTETSIWNYLDLLEIKYVAAEG